MHRSSAPSPRPSRLVATVLATALLSGGAATIAAAQEPVTDEALREQLQTRDAIIIELQRRLEELEQRLEAEGVIEAAPVEPTQPVARPRPQAGLVVDELAAERALERTLVEEGALLLRAGQAEISPSTSYTRRDFRFPAVLNDEVVEARFKRDEFNFGMSLNVGLPFDSQFELDVPYAVTRQEVGVRRAGQAFGAEDDWGNALGDISVGLAKTVWRERGGWAPDVVLRATYDSNTGERFDSDVPLGGGFNTVRGQVVALKRQDPLAFVGAFTYSYTFEDDDVKPGQQFALSLGANLAVSPQTSLSITLNQTYVDEVEINGNSINGSDQNQTTFDIGGSAIVAPRTLLRVVTSIGLTDDAPDYGLRASVAYRFNLPVF